jgi:hypothetical protein
MAAPNALDDPLVGPVDTCERMADTNIGFGHHTDRSDDVTRELADPMAATGRPQCRSG